MSIISVNNLTFSYDGSYGNIFEDADRKNDSCVSADASFCRA